MNHKLIIFLSSLFPPSQCRTSNYCFSLGASFLCLYTHSILSLQSKIFEE
ncbi:unnamed protein product, partial [Vitis vinifera]